MLRPVLGTEELEVDDREVRDDEGVSARAAEEDDDDDVESLLSSLSVKL